MVRVCGVHRTDHITCAMSCAMRLNSSSAQTIPYWLYCMVVFLLLSPSFSVVDDMPMWDVDFYYSVEQQVLSERSFRKKSAAETQSLTRPSVGVHKYGSFILQDMVQPGCECCRAVQLRRRVSQISAMLHLSVTGTAGRLQRPLLSDSQRHRHQRSVQSQGTNDHATSTLSFVHLKLQSTENSRNNIWNHNKKL